MRRLIAPLMLLAITCCLARAQPDTLPEWAKGSGVAMTLGQSQPNAIVFSDPSVWRHGKDGTGRGFLELHYDRKTYKSPYSPKHRSPIHIAILNQFALTDFAMDIEVMSTTELYGHQDACLFFGFQDPTHFYYVHLAPTPDANAHNVFIVNDAPRKNLLEPQKKGIAWTKDTWHKLRLLRQGSTGKIEVYFDDMTKPVLTANDTTFATGYVGFGSFDDTARFRTLGLSMKERPREEKAAGFFQPLGK